MEIRDRFPQRSWLALGLSLLVLFIIHFVYFTNEPFVSRDDANLINPLFEVTSLSDYFSKVLSNKILDFQPVRDLSFYINVLIKNWFNWSTFHITNFILFSLAVSIFARIMKRLNFSELAITFSILLFCFHPIMVSAIGWASSRKHVLGLVFVLMAILDFIKAERISYRTVVFYVLAILSHQIFALFPVWLLVYERIQFKKVSWKLIILLGFFGGSIIFAGTYKTFILEMGNVNYKQLSLFENISRFVLSIARGTSIILFPKVIAATYHQGSLWNLVGIPLHIFVIYLGYKHPDRNRILLWFFLAFVILVPTYIAFVNDTYLYLPLISFIIAFGIYLQNPPFKINNFAKYGITTVAIGLLFMKTVSCAYMWTSDKELWRYSYQQERDPYAAVVLATRIKNENPQLSFEFLVAGAKDFDLTLHEPLFRYFLQEIFLANIPIQEKIKIYEDCYIDYEVYKAYYATALIQGTKEQMDKGISILKPLFPPEAKYKSGSDADKIVNTITNICKRFPERKPVCDNLSIKI